jgi:hypothetical protein
VNDPGKEVGVFRLRPSEPAGESRGAYFLYASTLDGGLAKGSAERHRPPSVSVLVACCALSCAPGAKHQAATLLGAVDRFRDAADEVKAERARAVVAVRCDDATVCSAKRACEEAIVPSARAWELKGEISLRIRDIRGGRLAADSPRASELLDELHEAERLLGEGRSKMPECERLLAQLRVTFAL